MKCAMIILNYRDSKRAIELATLCARYNIIDKIVIVDNHSNDESTEQLQQIDDRKIEVIFSKENKGFSAGNNLGAKYIVNTYNPEFLLFANTDTCFPERNVSTCIEVLENNKNIGLISTNMVGIDGQMQNATYDYPTYRDYIKDFFWINRKKRALEFKKKKYENEVEYVDIVRGSFMVFRTKALIQAEFFDEHTFLYCEELIISTRLQKIGYEVAFIPKINYVHDHIEKSGSNVNSLNRLYESRLYYAREYMQVNKLKQLVFCLLAKYSLLEIKVINRLKKLRG